QEIRPVEEVELSSQKFEEHFLSACCHIGGIFAWVPVVGVAVPYAVWQIFKGESVFIDANGKEAFNFQMTLLLLRIPSYVLAIVGIGVVMIVLIELASIIFSIIAATRCLRGRAYQYPVRYRFIK
ncbi:MAG: DUF4870 domain-containing protein, partial [Verrucomicrobiota bacterium]